MTETRSQTQMKEAKIRETEGAFGARIEALEVKLENQSEKLSAKLDQHISDIAETLRLIVAQKDTASSSDNHQPEHFPTMMHPDPGRGRGGMIPHYSGMTRLTKLDFPRFNGEGMKDWLCKVDQFFLHGSDA